MTSESGGSVKSLHVHIPHSSTNLLEGSESFSLATEPSTKDSARTTTLAQLEFAFFGHHEDGLFHEPTSGFASSATNLLKTILGAGMLAMPAAFADLGYLVGTLFILISSSFAGFGLYLYVLCSQGIGRSCTINRLSKHTFPELSFVFDIAVAVKCFGVAVSYLIVIGDMMPGIVDGVGIISPTLQSREFWICLSVASLSPLAFLRRIDHLKYTSFLGILSVIYLIFLSIWNVIKPGAERPDAGAGIEPIARIGISSFKSFSVFVFSFTCHQNIFPIQRECRDCSPRFMKKLVLFSCGVAAAMYFAFSMASYANFGRNVQGNVFQNYPNENIEMLIARILFAFLSAFSYPLQTLPCRQSFEHLLPISTSMRRTYKHQIYILSTILILCASLLIAYNVSSLAFVSGLIGTFAGIPICYILPSIFYLKINGCDSRMGQGARGLLLFGLVAMLMTAGSLFIGLLYPPDALVVLL